MEYVAVGDNKSLLIPDLKEFPLGRKRLRGLRLVHTHLRGEPINQDDLNDLLLLRLDLLSAIYSSDQSGLTISISTASLDPSADTKLPYSVSQYHLLGSSELHLESTIASLEKSLELLDSKSSVSGDERAILVSVCNSSPDEAMDSMDELGELARTAGVSVLDTIIQRSRELSGKYLLGEGKIRELVIKALQLGATLLVFDQNLSPAQARSISRFTELKVIDRTQLILDIFARRAKTADGKVQVELAQLKYLLPHLSGQGIHMSRLMGGIGGRGPGESKLELDRRRIRDRISKLERTLKELSENRLQRRQKRVRSGLPIISIVGYTNAGKSTLLNTLTQSDVFTEDLLFATLDTATRRLRFPMEREVIVTDTVGFIRSLPESLLGAFKSTLEELNDANLLLHVVDCSNPRFREHVRNVDMILENLGLGAKERLLIFNKSDRMVVMKANDPLAFMKTKHSSALLGAHLISALDRKTLKPLISELEKRFWPSESDVSS